MSNPINAFAAGVSLLTTILTGGASISADPETARSGWDGLVNIQEAGWEAAKKDEKDEDNDDEDND